MQRCSGVHRNKADGKDFQFVPCFKSNYFFRMMIFLKKKYFQLERKIQIILNSPIEKEFKLLL